MKEYGYIHEFNCQQCSKKTIRKNRHKTSQRYCSQSCSQIARIGTKTNQAKKIEKAIKSFEKNVIKKDGCWGWKGRLIHGYGYISTKCFGSQRAHRVSYIIHKGKILDGLHVLHSCHNRSCTNPEHLRVGNQKENIKDKCDAFRQHFKVSNQKIIAIKIMLENGTFSLDEISKMFNTSMNCVIAIKRKII
jgi:hypothetical protein